MQYTQELLGYLAGLVDGEGCISLVRIKVKATGRWNYKPVIRIVNTHPFICDLASEVGLGYIHHAKQHDSRWKRQFIWSLNPNAIRQLLPSLVPYLRAKKRQALLLLDYLNLAQTCARAGGYHCDEEGRMEYHAQVDAIWLELAALNKRGSQH
jgi:hypothetical protein